MRIKSPSPSDSPRGKSSSRGEPTHFNPPSTGYYHPHVQRPDPRIIVILKCSQSFANILAKKMHAFSYSIKNIISFRRIVLPQRPRTRKTRVEEASLPPPLLPPIQLLSASFSVFLLLFLEHRHFLSVSLPPSLSLSFRLVFPFLLITRSFSHSFAPPERLDLFLFCFCSVPCHPRHFFPLPLSLLIFLPSSLSLWLALCLVREGEFSLLSSFLLSSLSLADITRGGNFAIFLGERFIEKLIMQLRNHPPLPSRRQKKSRKYRNESYGESQTLLHARSPTVWPRVYVSNH